MILIRLMDVGMSDWKWPENILVQSDEERVQVAC